METKAGVSLYLFGMGNIRTKLSVNNAFSEMRLQYNRKHSFIVKARDNDIDPMAIVSFFRFIPYTNSKSRRAEVSSVGTFTGANSNKLEYISFKGSKYGNSSYLLEVDNLPIGEYGIIILDPTHDGQKITVVSCFGVGDISEVMKLSASASEEDDNYTIGQD